MSDLKETSELNKSRAWEVSTKENEDLLNEIRLKSDIKSQELSNEKYFKTIENVTGEFGDVIPNKQLNRISNEAALNKPEIMSAEDYYEHFPHTDPTVLGHYSPGGEIYLKEGTPETINHVTTHEAMHLVSYKEIDDEGTGSSVYRSGIRETAYLEGAIKEDKNRALNEGITEMYTIREMFLRGDPEAIEAVNAYPEAQRKACELQGLLENDVIEKAYFGGELKLLEQEVNRLNYQDETAWSRYSHNIDILEYGTDIDEINEARRKLTIQNAIMHSCKEMGNPRINQMSSV